MKMNDHLIDFGSMDWESPASGVRYKAYIRVDHKIRLVDFSVVFPKRTGARKGTSATC